MDQCSSGAAIISTMRLPNRARRFWLPLVVLGGLLGVTPASAYYDDIHYALTYYIAR